MCLYGDWGMIQTNCLAVARYKEVINEATQLNNVGGGLIINKIKLYVEHENVW